MINPTTVSMIRDIVTIFGVIAGFSYYVLTVRNAQRNQALSLKAQEHATDTRQAQLLMQIVNQWSQPAMVDARDQFMRYELNSFEDYMIIWSARIHGLGPGMLDGPRTGSITPNFNPLITNQTKLMVM